MKRLVLASGVFDVQHPGHLYFLHRAGELGDGLVVVVTSDKTARAQGKSPQLAEGDRLQAVRALPCVDDAIIGDPGMELASVLRVKPDLIAIGYDQFQDVESLRDELRNLGWAGRIIRIGKYGAYSSSSLRRRTSAGPSQLSAK